MNEAAIPISTMCDTTTLKEQVINALMPADGFSSTIEQIQAHLSSRYAFKRNTVTNRVLVKNKNSPTNDFHYLEDYEFNSILREVKMHNIKCSKDTLRMLLFSDYVPSFDVYRSYLDDLPEWDGTDYVVELAKSVKTTQPAHFEFCLRKWLVAMVASLMDDNSVNHTAIVLSGPQGIGKTTWFHTILPSEFQEFIHEGYVQTKDKETSVKIAECVLVLMDELENLSDKSMDGVKQLMTQKGTTMRRAYTVISQYYSRRASFAGTVNKKHFLKDLTGNRRFLCFDVKEIDLNHCIPHDQLFAQLKHLYLAGFQYWFDESEIEVLNEMNAEFRDISVEEEAFVNHYAKCDVADESAQFLTTTQIQQSLIQKTGHRGLSIQSLGRILRDMKIERLKKNDRYCYAVKEK